MDVDEISDIPSLTEGSIRHGIWFLAWPAVLTMAIQSTNGLIDTYFIGRLHMPAALASIVMSNQITWLIMAVMSSVNVGTTALVARFVGAKSPQDVQSSVIQSFTLTVLGGLIMTLLAFIGMKPVVHMMSEDPLVQRLAIRFLTIVFCTLVPYFAFLTATSVFRGIGDTRTPLAVNLIYAAIKIFGDYVLILGRFGIPRMGVAGAATASVTAWTVGAILTLILLWRSPLGSALKGSWKPSFSWMWRILRIGIPAAAQNVLRSSGSWIYFIILAHVGYATEAQAALGIGLQLESLAFNPGFGFNIAAATLVGQNLGAKKPDRAEKTAWGAAWLSVVLMTVVAIFFVTFAKFLAGIFTTDSLVQKYVIYYLWINAISEPFLGLSMVLSGAFEGAGDTVPPTVITILCLWCIRLPLSYFLALVWGKGVAGAWVGMCSSVVLQGLVFAYVFKQGKWRNKRI